MVSQTVTLVKWVLGRECVEKLYTEVAESIEEEGKEHEG